MSPASPDRVRLLLDPAGNPVGTGAAWGYDALDGAPAGRVHWLAVHPSALGRGLGSALLAAIVQILRRHHSRSYLVTRPDRLHAIRLYHRFEYRPHRPNTAAHRDWQPVIAALGRNDAHD